MKLFADQLFEIPSLTTNDIRQLADCAKILNLQMPPIEPKFHSKKKISK